jgi:2-amino-4-hydroxy-6-hydroxymethyldihydropteridine diphosphokinase
MTQAFVAIGSNVEPQIRMPQAARELKGRYPDVRFSRCYSNTAFGFSGPDFYNAVAGMTTQQDIPELLQALQAIEALCGRSRDDPKWKPRAMDLDLLLFGDAVGSGPGYIVPRPDLTRRVYMLGPLAELAPDLIYPPSGPEIAALWSAFGSERDALRALTLDLNAA